MYLCMLVTVESLTFNIKFKNRNFKSSKSRNIGCIYTYIVHTVTMIIFEVKFIPIPYVSGQKQTV